MNASVLARLAGVQEITDVDRALRIFDGLAGAAYHSGRSRLTRTGNGLEYSVTCSQLSAGALRYTVDGTSHILDSTARLLAADRITRSALTELGSVNGLVAHDSVQSAIMNVHANHPALSDFAIWHGVTHTPDDQIVLKAYYNLRPWRVVPDRLLERLRAIAALGPVEMLFATDGSAATWPSFLGVEYDVDGVVAAKIYWQRLMPMFLTEARRRAADAVPNAAVAVLDFASASLLNGAAAFPAPAVVLSGKVSPRSDWLELGVHISLPACVSDDQAAYNVIRALMNYATLDSRRYEQTWAVLSDGYQAGHGSMIHSVVAIVISPGQARVTAYFDPPISQAVPIRQSLPHA